MPNLQATISNQLTATAAQTTLSIQELVTTMKAQGMADQAIRQTLLNDLNSGGQLFGSFKNKLKNTVKNGVELNAKDAVNNKYKDSGIKNLKWISVGDKSVCVDCKGRHRETGTYEFFETIGLPASGFSVCQSNCRCQLVPEDYEGENLDKPLIRDKKVPLKVTDFKMAGKHKTAKDSIAWMKSNIADKVTLPRIKDVALLNQITKSLKYNFEKYNLKRLDSITNQRGKSLAAANGRNLYINQSKFTKEIQDAIYKRNVTEYGKEWKNHLKLLKEKYAQAVKRNDYTEMAYFTKKIKTVEKRVIELDKFKRFNAFQKNNVAKNIIDHETGHIIHDQFTGGANGLGFRKNTLARFEISEKWNNEWIDIFKKAKKENLFKEISEYASANRFELFAESFSMYVNGEANNLPKIIKDYLDRYLTTTDFD